MDYLYEERVTFHPILGVVYGILLAFLVWNFFFGSANAGVLVLVTAVLVILLLLFGRLKVLVDPEMLVVGFGFFVLTALEIYVATRIKQIGVVGWA